MVNHPNISLVVTNELSDSDLKNWMHVVMISVPDGTLSSTELENRQLQFYRRKIESFNYYIAVLSRDLSEKEATTVAENFNTAYPSGDFEIKWSQPLKQDTRIPKITDDILKAIILEAAKLNHNESVKNKIKNGWRFGIQHNSFDKTSPLCQDWDQLPESYKKHEFQRMASLMNILKRMNLGFSRI